MPADVFDSWLVERIESAGWPAQGSRWNALLGGYSVEEWSRFTWSKEQLDLKSLEFSEDTLKIISGLSAARFENEKNAYTNIENSAARMQAIHDHIESTGRLPGSMLLIDGRPWEIIDGCHRITMYFSWLNQNKLSSKIQRIQEAWVARPARA